jgi:hypothetical protein
MKRFIIKILLFTTILAVVTTSLDYAVTQGLRYTGGGLDSEHQRWNDIFSANINADVLLMGSSRAVNHFNPAILDSILNIHSYNIGIMGYHFSMEYLRYKIYEKYNRKPKMIILNVDYWSLFHRKDPYNKAQFFPYIKEPLLQKELTELGFTDIQLYVPFVRYLEGLYYLDEIKTGLQEFMHIKHYDNNLYKGYQPILKAWDGTELHNMLAKNDNKIASLKEENMIRLFEDFLSQCKADNIKVVLVFTPMYIEATQHTEGRGEYMKIFEAFADRYNIPLLDYSNDSICKDTALFYNALHLNSQGADLFSAKLARDIQNLTITH